MTTTILGSNGKLGAMLAHFSTQEGLGWRTQARSGNVDVIWSGDYSCASVDDVFQKGSTIINMIGATAGTLRDMIDLNEVFVTRLLRKARQNGVAHVMLASSAAVYGAGGGSTPFAETYPLAPQTPYGKTKLMMENIANTDLSEAPQMAITLLRIGNVAGADALIDVARRHIVSGEPMPLHRFDDGAAPQRSYIGPRDLFSAIAALAKPHGDGVRTINVAHPQPVGLDAVLAGYRTHLMPDLNWVDAPAPQSALRSVSLSTSVLQQHLSFEQYDNPADAMVQQAVGLPST